MTTPAPTPEAIAEDIVKRVANIEVRSVLWGGVHDQLVREIAAALTSAANVPEGHVMLPGGRVVKVLGTLPMTADGCVATESQDVFVPENGWPARVRWSDEEGWLAECDASGAGDWRCYSVALCYSTREDALAARTTGDGGKGEGR